MVTAKAAGPKPWVATDAAVKAAESEPAKPFVFMRYMSGNVMSDSPQWKRIGTLVAVWPDGTIVRAESEELSGQSYLKGRLTAEQVSELRNEVDRSGVLTFENHVVPCGESTGLTVRTSSGMKTVAYWRENEMPTAFKDMKNYLFSLKMDNPTPVAAEQFKKYPHEWYK
ncbi:MAG: hypothetical protein IPK83_04515 [Planctomycetes bacterium]|nr:hypothetical protein [Planctomycetota bacterium]